MIIGDYFPPKILALKCSMRVTDKTIIIFCKLYDYICIDLNDDIQFGLKNTNCFKLHVIAVLLMQESYTGKHFPTLIEKNVSFIFLRLIFDGFIRQKTCVAQVRFGSHYFLC